MPDTGLLGTLRADWAANSGNPKGRFVVSAFRLAHASRGGSGSPIWAKPVLLIYKVAIDWVMGIEIPPAVEAGPGLSVWHGTGLVVHPNTVIGSNVMLRHGVTLGAVGDSDDTENAQAPVIGDGVSIGSGAIVIGPRDIGEGAIIGAGAVVVSDIPAGATAVGNPARILTGA
ncbi:MAG: serine acetyltransferase [Microthrixaceae bacterium]